jgi:hypothetical protein
MTDWPMPVVKTLFAHSGNTCAYPGCEARMTDPAWQHVNAQIAHISGERPGAPRYDAAMPDRHRWSYDNAILLCPNHHRRIDYLEPNEHPVERLVAMKRLHESRAEAVAWWGTDEKLETISALAIDLSARIRAIHPDATRAASLLMGQGPTDAVLRPDTIRDPVRFPQPTVVEGEASGDFGFEANATGQAQPPQQDVEPDSSTVSVDAGDQAMTIDPADGPEPEAPR